MGVSCRLICDGFFNDDELFFEANVDRRRYAFFEPEGFQEVCELFDKGECELYRFALFVIVLGVLKEVCGVPEERLEEDVQSFLRDVDFVDVNRFINLCDPRIYDASARGDAVILCDLLIELFARIP